MADKPTLYAFTAVPANVVDRDRNGIYFIRTANGFIPVMISKNDGSLVPLDIESGIPKNVQRIKDSSAASYTATADQGQSNMNIAFGVSSNYAGHVTIGNKSSNLSLLNVVLTIYYSPNYYPTAAFPVISAYPDNYVKIGAFTPAYFQILIGNVDPGGSVEIFYNVMGY